MESSIHHQVSPYFPLHPVENVQPLLPTIVMITSYPPRECGIATYANDLYNALQKKFNQSFDLEICALEQDAGIHHYPKEVKYILNTNQEAYYTELANKLNNNETVQLILLQHEFGFYHNNETAFIQFLLALKKPYIIALHTVLGNPSLVKKHYMQQMLKTAEKAIVMTNHAASILMNDYDIASSKIAIISHGTHLVKHADKLSLKKKYGLTDRVILSTFGLLNSGKSIETTLDALVDIIKQEPKVLFLIIGITHPGVIKHEGEIYRDSLKKKITALHLEKHVLFINQFLELPELLNYLQLTDIYLFTSNNPNQAVSGTFSYAISSGCPIIATGIPHAVEVLSDNTGTIVDFNNSQQLSKAVLDLLFNDKKRGEYTLNGIHKLASSAWENSALKHVNLFKKHIPTPFKLSFSIPPINLSHLKHMTTSFGMIQFAKLNKPDYASGYTLDDNARALLAMTMCFENTRQFEHLYAIEIYVNFIEFCQSASGDFLNYVNQDKAFTIENYQCNLADSNGRAIWALGYLIGLESIFPTQLIIKAKKVFQKALATIPSVHSTRSMAFMIKGLYFSNQHTADEKITDLINILASRIYQMYLHESSPKWDWFESYLTYANSLLPEAMLYAYKATKGQKYKQVALKSFHFLLSQTFTPSGIHVISNKNWHTQNKITNCNLIGGEQPIDVAYTILTLESFYQTFKTPDYKTKIKIAFDWFQGRNHLNEIIYNPCTGGCYDGLEDSYVNLNQGAESTLSYLISRFIIARHYFPNT